MRSMVSMFMIAGLLLNASGTYAMSEFEGRIWNAREVLEEYSEMPEKTIPASLLANAKAIAIFPGMVKAGFIFAGQFGNGVILRREGDTWSAPAFFRMSGGSVGFQIGGQSSDSILIITSERGIQGLLENKFTLGADASVAAGPTGRDAEAKTDWQIKSSIYSYSRNRGLFAGISLDGMVINQDKKANASYYGSNLTAEKILYADGLKLSQESMRLISTLKKLSK